LAVSGVAPKPEVEEEVELVDEKEWLEEVEVDVETDDDEEDKDEEDEEDEILLPDEDKGNADLEERTAARIMNRLTD
jgi:hypothetical protein